MHKTSCKVCVMDVNERLKKAHTGDRETRNRLVEENLGLVRSIVKRFRGRGYDEEDLFQIGCIGLIKAIDRFDTAFGVKLSTYAVPLISGEIKRFLRDDGMIKVSRTIKENYQKVGAAAGRLGQELGRNATIDEIAGATGLSREEIVLAMESGNEVDSIDRIIYESEGRDISFAEQVTDVTNSAVGYAGAGERLWQAFINENGAPVDAEKDKVLDKILLSDLLGGLEKMERQLVQYRYFHDMTQTQVAKIFGISQVQVSRMEKKIITRMRQNVH